LDEVPFVALIRGKTDVAGLDRDWAIVRLLENASYADIVRLPGFRNLIEGWPDRRRRIRSPSRLRGLDFLVEYIPSRRPEWLN
jgi:hypothetical protein